jgi:phenylpropionate dioxygenase-like ring-hydroxylating dioxygenase large terminal subunit
MNLAQRDNPSVSHWAGPGHYQPLVVNEPQSFRVHREIYTNPAIFDDELQRIFATTWVYLAHASEVPKAGDYRTTWIGRQPVIVTRDDEMQLHVLLNSCRHRGNALCREVSGNARRFRCSYHGWVYSNRGDLLHVSLPEGYPEQFNLSGLIPVPRVSVYRGLIFGSLAKDGEDFDTYLGGAKSYVDLWADMSPMGKLKLKRPHQFVFPGNWKLQVENSTDGYHARFLHESAFATMAKFGDRSRPQTTALQNIGMVSGFDGGHGVLEKPQMAALEPAIFGDYVACLAEKYGKERADHILGGYNVMLFPNVCLMDSNIRVIQPLAVNETVVASYFTELEGVPDHVNRERLRDLQWRLGTAGLICTDDIELFSGVQTGLQARDMEWIVLSRSVDRETVHSTGQRVAAFDAEAPQRALYREWLKLMCRPQA